MFISISLSNTLMYSFKKMLLKTTFYCVNNSDTIHTEVPTIVTPWNVTFLLFFFVNGSLIFCRLAHITFISGNSCLFWFTII